MLASHRLWVWIVVCCGVWLMPTLLIADEWAEVVESQKRVHKLYGEGKYAAAIPLAQELVRRGERLVANHPQQRDGALNLAELLNDLALLYDNQARYAEAVPLYKRSLNIKENTLGPEHPNVATSLNNIALSYFYQSRYAEAEPLYLRSLKIREKALGPEHPYVAESLTNLAALYDNQARYAEAEPLHKRSLKIRVKALGPDHLDVANSLSELAISYYYQARYVEAESYYQQSLKIREKTLGPEHPNVATSLNNLAALYDQQARYTEAEPLHQRSLKIREKTLGPEHPNVAFSLHNLADLYVTQGRYAEAEPLHQRSLKIRVAALGPDHLDVSYSLNSLAKLFKIQGRYAEAEPLYQRSLKIREKTLGTDHPDVATSLNNLGLLYAEQGGNTEAISLLQRSLKIKEKALGPDHPDVALSLNNLGDLHETAAESEPLYQRSLKIREKALGPDHPDVTFSLHSLAILYDQPTRYAEAMPLLDRVIAIRDRASIGADARYRSYLRRSRIAWKLQDRQRALTDLRKAMDLAESARQQSSGAERERAEFFSTLQSAFEQMIAWQQELGDDADLSETLSAMERSRSRSLLDELSTAGTNLYFGRPASERDRLQREEIDLKSRAAQLEKQWTNAKTPEERNRLLPDLAKAREAVYQHYRDLRASSPVYRQLLSAGGTLVTLRQLQQTLTPDNSLLLVYFLGEQAGYVASIQADRVKLTSLTVNDETAKNLGCDAGPLTAKRMQSLLMNADKTGVLQKLSSPTTAQKATAQLATLWPLLIPEEAREQIHSGKLQRLMIVPDGPLGCLPFETLVIRDGDAPSYLLDVAPPIQYAPSATVLFNLQQKVSANPDPTLKPVLAIGNANYGQGSQSSSDSLAMLKPGARYAKQGGHLQSLPYSGTEVTWVSDVFSKQGIAVGKLLQADATEAKIRYNIPGRRIVHIACHGLVDQEYGNFFGSLAVTPGAKAATDPSDDGFLTLAEIYQIDFKSCELAILSACDTNFGPHQKGEGTWAMSRGFLVAGAKRVAASNWLVDDEAAATLISYFTGGVALDLGKSATPNYAKRLLDAKKQVREQEKWASPYYWGGFVLVGPE